MLNHMLSHLRPGKKDAELTPEQIEKQEADAKSERIKFHRENVRNGPRSFRYATSGTIRRLRARDDEAQRRKATRTHRRQWMANQRKLATLRGHLVILGVIECQHEGTTFPQATVRESGVWVVRNFAQRDDDGQIIEHDDLFSNALEAARDAYLQATGAEVKA